MDGFFALYWDGNLAGEFDTLAEAQAALEDLAEIEPDLADDATIVQCDKLGSPVGKPIARTAA